MDSADDVGVGDEPNGVEENVVRDLPPSARKEFIFDRILRAITGENPSISCMPHVHSPLPRHHHQGHRLDSICSTQHDESNRTCSMNNCTPQHCSVRQEDQHQQLKQHPINKATCVTSTRDRSQSSASSTFSTLSNLFASTLPSHSHDNVNSNSDLNLKSRSFFNVAFRSKRRSRSPAKRISSGSTTTRCTTDPLLYGTSNHDQHEAVIITALHVCDLYHRGYDMSKMNRCSESDADVHNDEEGRDVPKGVDVEDVHFHDDYDHRARHALRSLGFEFRLDACQECRQNHDSAKSIEYCEGEYKRCPNCVTRLYHVPSDTAVSKDNRKQFIADGKMYDAIADLCQEVAQEIMAEACDLVWVTVCDGRVGGLAGKTGHHHCAEGTATSNGGNHVTQNPVKALVGRKQHDVEDDHHPHDTFLISTGNGKVRAGIFSRYHLLTTGLEQSTALPLLREARSRGMNCVVIDPNARGDGFDVSIQRLFEQQCMLKEDGEQCENGRGRTRGIIPADDVKGSVFVLAHSAAGGQLVRYLLKQQQIDAPLLPRIRCITFTDSTHSVQWVKNHPNISSLIQSSRSLYVRSANPMRDDDWENAAPGDECPSDHFWSHRFGSIRTVWAGTTEHSLSNWTSHRVIWDHVDKVRGQVETVDDTGCDNEPSSEHRDNCRFGSMQSNK